jgi:membrane protein implicated in regulation of membrane protease activity
MTGSVWFIVAIVLFAIEILTPGVFFFACLGMGALGAAIAWSLYPQEWATWSIFALVSLSSIYFLRPLARKYIKQGKKTNVDALLNQKAWVTDAISPPAYGMVKVGGDFWRAEAAEPIAKDTWVIIEKVDGTHLVVHT